MNICVFGADGYLGSSVFQKLKENGDHTIAGTSFRKSNTDEAIYELDINQPEAFSSLYKELQADVIIWTLTHPLEEDRLINQGLAHLITHITPATKLVFISSAEVFGEGDGPYTEEDVPVKVSESHPNAYMTNAKIKAEYLVSREVTNHVIIRSGPVYGENRRGKKDRRTAWLEENLAEGKQIKRCSEIYRSFTHIDDLTDFVIEMALRDDRGIFHATSGQSDSYYTFYRKMAEELGYNPIWVKEQKAEELTRHLPENMVLQTIKTHRISNVSFRTL